MTDREKAIRALGKISMMLETMEMDMSIGLSNCGVDWQIALPSSDYKKDIELIMKGLSK